MDIFVTDTQNQFTLLASRQRQSRGSRQSRETVPKKIGKGQASTKPAKLQKHTTNWAQKCMIRRRRGILPISRQLLAPRLGDSAVVQSTIGAKRSYLQ